MELTFKEPDILTVPDYENGKRIERKFEIVPLPVDQMKMTVQFQEIQLELDKHQSTIKELKDRYATLKNKNEGKKKKEAVSKQQDRMIHKVIKELKEASVARERFIIDVLLPKISEIIKLGLIDFDTGESVTLPKRHQTLPKMMSISMRILDLTTETDKEDDTNFQQGEAQKKDLEQLEQE